MASETEKLNGKLEVDDGPSANINLEENRKLRDAGLEYVSHSGKTIAAKVQPEELCNCPQRCGDKIPEQVRKYLFTEFYKIGDHIQQNNYLQKHIEMRSVQKRLWDDNEHRVDGRLQRRVSCKYHIPTEIPKDVIKGETNSADMSKSNGTQPPVRKLNAKHKVNTVEVCQKAFMNTYAITEKRIRLQREKLITKSRKEAGIQAPYTKDQSQLWTHDLIAELCPLLMNREILANISSFENMSTLPSDVPTKILHAIDNDISIVNNFFCNQLWKPEYIDCNFDKSSFCISENNDDYYKNAALRSNKTNGESVLFDINSPKNISADKSPSVSTPKYMASTNLNNKNISFTKIQKPIAPSNSMPSTPKNIKVDDSVSKTPISGSSKNKQTPDAKYLSFENSSISITPVNSTGASNSTSSSIYNSINFGNSSISITPLYRQ